MNIKKLPVWLQVFVGFAYGSILGLCIGYFFSIVVWGGVMVLARVITATGLVS